jgi:hypothetical protein
MFYILLRILNLGFLLGDLLRVPCFAYYYSYCVLFSAIIVIWLFCQNLDRRPPIKTVQHFHLLLQSFLKFS